MNANAIIAAADSAPLGSALRRAGTNAAARARNLRVRFDRSKARSKGRAHFIPKIEDEHAARQARKKSAIFKSQKKLNAMKAQIAKKRRKVTGNLSSIIEETVEEEPAPQRRTRSFTKELECTLDGAHWAVPEEGARRTRRRTARYAF